MPFHAMPWTASTAPGPGHDERLLDGAGPRSGPRALAASSESAIIDGENQARSTHTARSNTYMSHHHSLPLHGAVDPGPAS